MDILESNINEFQYHPYTPSLNMSKAGGKDFIVLCFKAKGILTSNHTTVVFYDYTKMASSYTYCPHIPPVQYLFQDSEETFHRVFFILKQGIPNTVTLTPQTLEVLETLQLIEGKTMRWQNTWVLFEVGEYNWMPYDLVNYQIEVKQEKRKAYDNRGQEIIGKFSLHEIKIGVAHVPPVVNEVSELITQFLNILLPIKIH